MPNNIKAFPREALDNRYKNCGPQLGMTLKQYYAGQALAGFCSAPKEVMQIVIAMSKENQNITLSTALSDLSIDVANKMLEIERVYDEPI